MWLSGADILMCPVTSERSTCPSMVVKVIVSRSPYFAYSEGMVISIRG